MGSVQRWTYSFRNAATGSSRAARQAGKKLANTATSDKPAAAKM
jgi:hypothetical protein